jgi:hypothetical protein
VDLTVQYRIVKRREEDQRLLLLAIDTTISKQGPAPVRWVNLTCPEREAKTASAKQQLVFSKVKTPTRMQRDAYISSWWLRCRG